MARGKHRRYMELVAYHIYHLENRTQVIPWREVTPAMVAKYEAFSRQCMEDYLRKKEDLNRSLFDKKSKENPRIQWTPPHNPLE